MIPDSFAPPRTYRSASFGLEVLSQRFATPDYEAVTASVDDICHVFGPANGWPSRDIGFAENLADLTRHEREFTDRIAFAYAILSPDGDQYLGCLYLKPIKSRIENDPRKAVFDAQAFFWLSSRVIANGLEARVLQEVRAWLDTAWPFRAVAFPGRVIDWATWDKMA